MAGQDRVVNGIVLGTGEEVSWTSIGVMGVEGYELTGEMARKRRFLREMVNFWRKMAFLCGRIFGIISVSASDGIYDAKGESKLFRPRRWSIYRQEFLH